MNLPEWVTNNGLIRWLKGVDWVIVGILSFVIGIVASMIFLLLFLFGRFVGYMPPRPRP
ncbi:MAG: hypothetical protein ABIJ92_01240 [Candidatus Aenigmatarchaeota archaeon]